MAQRKPPYDPLLHELALVLRVTLGGRVDTTAYLLGVSPSSVRRWLEEESLHPRDPEDLLCEFALELIGELEDEDEETRRPMAKVIELFPDGAPGKKG